MLFDSANHVVELLAHGWGVAWVLLQEFVPIAYLLNQVIQLFGVVVVDGSWVVVGLFGWLHGEHFGDDVLCRFIDVALS